MHTIKDVLQMITKVCYMTSIDLKDAYHSVKIDPQYQCLKIHYFNMYVILMVLDRVQEDSNPQPSDYKHSNWMLHINIFDNICKKLKFYPEIDCFANRLNHQSQNTYLLNLTLMHS